MDEQLISQMQAQILLISADAVLSTALSECLTAQGYGVEICATSDSGWTRLSAGMVQAASALDLVLIDVQNAELGGLSLLQQIRRDNQFALLPVLVLVGEMQAELPQLAFDYGANDYLFIPVRTVELLSRVRAFLNLRLAERAQQRRTERLVEAGKLILSTLQLDVVLSRILQIVVVELDAEGGSLWMPAADGRLECKVVGRPEEARLVGMTLDPGVGIAGWVFQTGQAVVVSDLLADPRYFPQVSAFMGSPSRNLMAVPLLVREQGIGVLEVINCRHGAFSARDLAWLEALTPLAAATLENARLYEQTCRDAAHLRALLDSIQDEIVVTDRALRVMDMNAALLQKLACPRDEVIGRPYMDFLAVLYPQAGSSDPLLVSRVLESGQSLHALQLNDEQGTWVSRVASPLYNAQGQVDWVVETTRDVTAEWEAQSRLTAVHQLSSRLAQLPDVQGVADAVLDVALSLFHVAMASVWIWDEGSMSLRRLACRQLSGKMTVCPLAPLHEDSPELLQAYQDGELVYLAERRKTELPSVLALPLKAGGRVLGVLSLEHELVDAFQEDERRLGIILAEVSAIALYNRQLFQREQQTGRYLRTLSQAVMQASAGLQVGNLLAVAVRTLVYECNMALSGVWLVSADGLELELRAAAGTIPQPEYGRVHISMGEENRRLIRIVREGRPVITNHVQQEVGFDHVWAQTNGVRAFAGYPLTGEGGLQGAVTVFSQQVLEEEILNVLGVFANQFSIVLENARLFEAVNRRNGELSILHRISEIALAPQSQESVFAEIVKLIGEVTACAVVGLGLYDIEHERLVFKALGGLMLDDFTPLGEVALGSTVARHVSMSDRLLIEPLLQLHHRQLLPVLEYERIETFICVPLKIESRIIGMLSLAYVSAFAADEQLAQWLGNLANQIAAMIERRRAEEQLQEREALYRTLIETSPDAMALCDLDLNLLLLNERAGQLYGYRDVSSMLSGERSVRDLVIPEERERLDHMAQAALVLKEVRELEFTFLRNDGSRFPGELSVRLVADAQGRPRALASIARDITERKQAEETLRTSEEYFRALIEHAWDAVVILDANLKILYASPSFKRVLGYDPDVMIGHYALNEVHADDIPNVFCQLQALMQNPAAPCLIEARLRHHNGAWCIIEGIASNMLRHSAVKGLVLNFRDITVRKQARQTLLRVNAAIESTSDAIAIADPDGVDRYHNRAFQDLVGYSPEELNALGGPVALYAEQQKAREMFAHLLRGESWHGELTVKAQDGRLIPVSLRADTIRDPSGAVVGLVGIHTDITEQRWNAERERRHIRDLVFLSESAMHFVELPLEVDIYQAIAIQLKKLVGNAVVMVSAFDPISEEFSLRALLGADRQLPKVFKMIGQDPFDVRLRFSEDSPLREALSTGSLEQIDNLYELFFHHFSEPLCQKWEKILHLEGIYVVGFMRKDELFGDAVIMPRRGAGPLNQELIEAFISQASVVLQRRLAESALRESERRYRVIFNSSNDAAFVYGLDDDANLHFVEVNDVACRRLGYTREELLALAPTAVEVPEMRLRMDAILSRLQVERQTLFETTLVTRFGQAIPVEVNALLFELNGQPSVLALARDITERKEAEDERMRFTAQLRAAAELAEQINVLLDPELLLQEVGFQLQVRFDLCYVALYLLDEEAFTLNRKAVWGSVRVEDEGEFHVSLELRNCPIAQAAQLQEILLCEGLDASWGPWLQSGMQSEVVAPLSAHGRLLGVLDIQDLRADRFKSSDLDVFSTLTGQIATALENARLFGEVQRTASRLQTLSHRLVEVQEIERRTIARELHDEIGQILTGLKLVLEMGTRSRAEVDWASLEEARSLVNELIDRVRQLSLDLRPPMLDDLGLLPALLWHFERYTAQTHVQVQFRHSGLERRFSSQIETAGYRIVQEALTNVARYAQADEVTVRLWALDDLLSVQIEDQGCGFEPGPVLSGYHSSGISGIRERVRLLGGFFTIESAPGEGTRLIAELPLR